MKQCRRTWIALAVTIVYVATGLVLPVMVSAGDFDSTGPPTAGTMYSLEEMMVTLDGSESTDAQSSACTNDDIFSFAWYKRETLLRCGEIISHSFLLSVQAVSLIVEDHVGNTDSNEAIINVQDTTAPTIRSFTADSDIPWSPNEKMVPVSVWLDAEDIGDPASRISGVSGNKSVDGPGDGDTESDWESAVDFSVDLLAEFASGGTERVYTLYIECLDASSNAATDTVMAFVPFSKRRGR